MAGSNAWKMFLCIFQHVVFLFEKQTSDIFKTSAQREKESEREIERERVFFFRAVVLHVRWFYACLCVQACAYV